MEHNVSYASLYGSGAFKLGRGLYTEGCVDDYTEEEYSKHKRLVESKIINNDFIRIDKSTVLKYDPKFILMSIYGERLRSRFLNGTEGFIDLMNYLTEQFNQQNQFIKSLDDRFVYCNSAHKSLNVLLQSSGAIFMKYYLLNVFYSLTKEGLKLNRDYANIANIHDALVLETYPQYRTIICDTLVKSFTEVSNRFNFSYPIKGYPIIHNNLYDIFVDEKEKRTYFKFDDY